MVALVIIGALILWGLWASLKVILPCFGVDVSLADLGQWGDSFGALNTLVSGFALAALVYTIRQQQNQISQTQIERNRDRFEQVFFDVLRLIREARDEVRFRYSEKSQKQSKSTATGRIAFRDAWTEVRPFIKKDMTAKSLSALYEDRIHTRYESSFGPYFRLIYTLLLRIKTESSIKDKQRYEYARLLRSQLSSSEVTLLALNGLSPVSKDLFDLIVYFRMLKYLPETLDRRATMQRYYPKVTFLARD